MNKLDLESKNIINDNITKIGELFPNTIVETENGIQLDFDLLKQELSNTLIEGNKEKYQLTWPGKKESILLANTPTNNSLRPLTDKSVDFDNTQNIYIEGDNLEALKILQESYLNKIKCIYIDPPYNTGNDFIYSDNFNKTTEEELSDSGQIDEEGNRLVTNSQSNGRYHSDWLSMMYPRLKLARNLLTDDGVIFISIDEHELFNLKRLCDDIFGEGNYIENFIWIKNSTKNLSKTTSTNHEYVLVYAKNKSIIEQENMFRVGKEGLEEVYNLIEQFQKENLTVNEAEKGLKEFYKNNPRLKGITMYNKIDYKNGEYLLYRLSDISAPKSTGKAALYDIIHPITKKACKTPSSGWRFTEEKMKQLISKGSIYFYEDESKVPAYKRYLHNVEEEVIKSIIQDFKDGKKELMNLFGDAYFDNAKPTTLINYLIKSVVNKNDIILDFFSGSATTAHAIMQLNAEDGGNRKHIMIQIPEVCDEKSEAFKAGYNNICEIGQERIRRAGKKIKEETGADIDYGFRVYKIDSSNMKDIFYKPNDIKQEQLKFFETNIKEDRTNEDLLTQVMLDLGLTLDLKIEVKKIMNNKVYFVEENSLIACFDNNINMDIVEEIVKYNPLKVIFKDESFNVDNDKINIIEKFKKLSPETEISIL